jgi:hypothetical protein
MTPTEQLRLEALVRGLRCIWTILRKLWTQLQPFGLSNHYTEDLRRLDAAIADLEKAKRVETDRTWEPALGSPVRYVDEEGNSYIALVTDVRRIARGAGETSTLNVVYVSRRDRDDYGLSIRRATTVPWRENKLPEHREAFYVERLE